MIRSLVAVSPDIEASIALRFACELAHFCEMSIQAIYAKEPELPGTFSEIGWARRTWEREMIEKFEKEISKLVTTESRFCPVAINPIVTTGDREKVILDRLKSGEYDLFIEGAVSMDPDIIHERLESRLYTNAPVPVILVRNLLKIKDILILLEEDKINEGLINFLEQIFQKKDFNTHVYFLEGVSGSPEELHSINQLKDKGFSVRRVASISSDSLPGECGLVVTSLNRQSGDIRKLGNTLGKIDAPILFFWQD